jgi:hypothetical protein
MQIPNFTTAIFGLAGFAGLSTAATLRRISYPVMVCKECDPSTDWPLCIQDPMGDCVESGTLTLLHNTWAYTNVVPGKSNVCLPEVFIGGARSGRNCWKETTECPDVGLCK